jgi:hypothetical protein
MGQYVPTGQAIEQELQSIAQAMQSPNAALFLTPLAVAPLKPRDGMVVMANGTTFNPGSGAGFYGYRAGAWRFLG